MPNSNSAALYSFMEQIGLLDLEPHIHVESYNDILSERVLSCLTSGEITISLPDGKPTGKDGYPSEREPQYMTWPKDFHNGIEDAKSLINGLDKKPQVLLRADGKYLDPPPREHDLTIDMAYWDKTGRIDGEDKGTTGPRTINASLIWRMVMYETIRAAIINEST
ncbi:hypothetical protein FSARC_5272 [Fusarium sarcochroum]|uniref:Uncharacterized protein n=1 Tax=Fusarium sarcochroum TaxID=1208366 RepID=A0A8H4XAK7_9HYPO|nr:hypothetical protein FSARC_5272 [Fusarium sarcochroum]